jgi:alkylhydroperoxidase/carboxymuconolactone decarboxylase family protein YurZ
MNEIEPDIQAILNAMTQSMGSVPPAIAKAAAVDSQMVVEQVHSSAFAMPPDGGALDSETRTLIYLGAALASSNHACTQAMVNKAKGQGIAREKLLEAFHIARFALATRVVGDAEPLFEMLAQRENPPAVAA